MFNVVLALLPVTGFAIYAFGLAALLTLTTAVISCVVTEFALCRVDRKSKSPIGDWSVTCHGTALWFDAAAIIAALDDRGGRR